MRGSSHKAATFLVGLGLTVCAGLLYHSVTYQDDTKAIVVCSINTPQGPVITGDGEIPEAKLVEGRVEGKDFTYVMGPHEGCAITRITKTK